MKVSKETLRQLKETSGLVTCWVYQVSDDGTSSRIGSWKSDDVETAKNELRDEIELYCQDGAKNVYGEVRVGGELAPNGFLKTDKEAAEVVHTIANDKDLKADEYVCTGKLDEKKTYSVFVDTGDSDKDEYKDFDSEKDALRYADSLDKKKLKGYIVRDKEGDVVVDYTRIHGKRDIFTYDLCSINDETGEAESFFESGAFYDFDEAVDKAKEEVKGSDEPVVAFVYAGEYEKDNGDIYGEPTAVLSISNSRSIGANEYV